MAQPTAPSGDNATLLPQRAHLARILLWTAAPFSFVTFLTSGAAAKDATSAILIVLAFLAPVVLVYVGLRVKEDHAPAAPTAHSSRIRRAAWDWTDVAAFIPATGAVVLFSGSLLVGLTQAVDRSLEPTARTAVESFAAQAAAYTAALAALIVLVVLRRGLPFATLGWRFPRSLRRVGWYPWLAIAVVGAFVTLEVADWLGVVATHLLPNSPNTQCTAVRDEYGGYVAVAIPLVCLIAPFAEETIFRGFIYGWLRRHLAVLPAVLISAAVFSAAHAVLVLALPLFGVGVILALLYEYSGSLLPGAIVHGLFNLVGIIMILGTTTTC